ncbi:NAD(+) diphosphatase [Hoeflea prorocentri]|uniref:NAD(+) diphosphatase n=1 Tax=Hoeflea prorocentri TaxID=1922333 RepID=A0A9X3ULU1_9HYPH|nr:NAD(+) diphosphatase [Hoeflea prorocentri]MCY6382931.1 NAD(+) diphosphatase [Hoeflea prorocentri]MDA5400731.1 NAD(+) diphosphatase [Hoeflea prorocentri]
MSIFEAPGRTVEPSSHVAFAGNRLDRRSEHRHDGCLEEALASPLVRAYALRNGRAFLHNSGDRFRALHSLEELQAFDPDMENAVLMGFAEGEAPRIAAHARLEPETLPETIKAIDHRSIYIQGLLDGGQLGELAQAASLVTWSQTHLHCGRCSAATLPKAGGYRRECSQCGLQLFPRTDPVVIMLTVDLETDRCLLGRSPHFPPGMYSCLAGFLEPGETIEEAVRRETFEESGIRIGRVRYHASQPWPMPHTLMVGCYGEAISTDIQIDAREIEDCRWFSRDETASLIRKQTGVEDLRSPPPGAIAHHLIRDWLQYQP